MMRTAEQKKNITKKNGCMIDAENFVEADVEAGN
jgi:hypothetical protein